MIKRLDRYVGKTLAGSYAATLLFVVFLFTVMDLLLNLGRYVTIANEKQLTMAHILWTWLCFQVVRLPWLLVLVGPFVTVISCMFAVTRLMSANEVTPMLFTGRSSARVLLPCVLLGCLSAGTMALLWEYALPATSKSMSVFEQSLSRGDSTGYVENVVLFAKDPRKRLMVDRYQPDLQRMEGVVVMDLGTREEDLSQLVAESATWNPERADWELIGGRLQCGQHIETREWLGMDGMTPEIVWLSARDADASSFLSYSELRDLILLSPQRNDLQIAMQYHFTWPLANLILLLLSLPFAIHFERGSKMGRSVFAIVVCACYLIVDITCQDLGRHEFLHPILASWTPAILFGSLGLVMFGSMRS